MPFDSQGRWYESNETLSTGAVASAARTATATGTAFSTASLDSIDATLTITAAAGTDPTLDVTLETTTDGTNYYTLTPAFPQQTGAAAVSRTFDGLGSSCRWKWTIGGTDTPSFTFSIAATADRDE